MHLANFILFYIITAQISSIDREQKMHLVLIFSSTCTDNIACWLHEVSKHFLYPCHLFQVAT